MEVAASLPNIMNIFPLKIMMRERSPTPQQEAFLSGQEAAANIDEEMEEGEIDPREDTFFSSSNKILGVLESIVVPVAAQHACSVSPPHFIEENTVISATAHRLPRLSSVPDDMELEHSVEALHPLPNKLPLQGQVRFGTSDNILQFSSHSDIVCLASSPFKKPEESASFVKVSQRLSPVSCPKACSTLSKLSQAPAVKEAPPCHELQLLLAPKDFINSTPKTQSSVSKQSPVPLLRASSTLKKPEAYLSVKEPLVSSPTLRAEGSSPSSKLQVSSPQANQPKTSSIVPTHQRRADFKQQQQSSQHCPDVTFDKQHSRKPSSVDVDSQLSVAQTLDREPLTNPHEEKILGHTELSFKELQICSEMNFVSSLAPVEGPSFPKQLTVSCRAAIRELQAPPEPACLEVSIQHCQVSSLPREPPIRTSSPSKDHRQSSPIIPLAPGSRSESQILTPLGSNGTQLDISRVPSATTNSNDERSFISCANGKRRPRSSAIRDYPEGCGRILPATTNQLLVERSFSDHIHDKVTWRVPAVEKPPLSGHSLVSRDEQVSSLDGQTALSLHKSPNASVLPLKRQTAEFIPTRKGENQIPTDCLLQTKPKKFKVRPLSRTLSCETKRLSPASADRSSQIQWFLEGGLFGHDHPIKAVRPLKQWSRPRLPKSSAKLVPFLSENPKGSEDALSPPDADCGASSRLQVKRTLQEFDCVRRSLAMAKERHFRPDLAAAKILKNKGRWRNCGGEKIVGDVPGVEVGDQFSFRIEMLIVGLHRQVQGGIDYIAGSVRPRGPLATSIVASGGYEDDDDCGATFIYTGQGGNNYKGDRRQGRDQVLKRGNLALSNSFRERTPVRVIRGSTDDKFYTYDGLYDVIDCWFQTGVAGFGVYQYKLSRRPGQPELVSTIVKFMGSVKKRGLARPHLLLGDLSHGKERLPVSVVNEVDGEAAPEYFTYTSEMKYPRWYCPVLSRGCDCVGGCIDASKCLCAAKNGGEFPYNELGQIVRGKKMVFECGKSCACPSSCYNRVSQKGLRHQLEVFKTPKSGWGVRSLEPIRPGDFIGEYTGELLSDADAERRTECDEYLFDIGHRTNTWMDVSDLMDINKGKATVPVVEDTGYTIDARLLGSVARFINHSCSPNLYAQDVVYDSDDLRFPHVLLFAMENIPPMRELSYDYNYTIGHVRDANGDVKAKACYCGARDCRGRLY